MLSKLGECAKSRSRGGECWRVCMCKPYANNTVRNNVLGMLLLAIISM